MTTAAPPVVHAVIGHSVQGRPIRVIRVGSSHARRRILVVGVIHGNETAGRPIVRLLARARPRSGVALWLVPTLNPDGEVAGTRQNARHVDLNRNFGTLWRPLGFPGSTYYAGSRAFSEPESRALRGLVRRVRPTESLFYHQHRDLVYREGGAHPGLITAYARRVGLRVRPSPHLTGTAIRWENARIRGSTAWVVELPAGRLSGAAVRRHARAVLAVGRS
jgi:murein peptide amidase A